MKTKTKLPFGTALFLGYLIPTFAQGVVDETRFWDCDPQVYYNAGDSNTTQWTRESLRALIATTHRKILPLDSDQSSKESVYAALIDLDRGGDLESIKLVYRDIEVSSTPQANVWEIERLWHLKEDSNEAFTDIHHLRPIDATVAQEKTSLSFGMCDTVAPMSTCESPATSETAWDTAQDGKIWQPPQSKRGEIARALLYMELRYDELTLKDCDPSEGQMAYLSQLLEWNSQYPPTDSELLRNDRACSRWQGNRNPFVDYPGLAEVLHGKPQELTSSRTYPGCADLNDEMDGQLPVASDAVVTSTPPVSSSAPSVAPVDIDPCTSITNGSLPFFLVNTRDPDEVVILALEDIAGGMELYLTDQAWDGVDLVRAGMHEGTVMMTTPKEGIPAGSMFGFGPQAHLNELWTKDEGTFSLGLDGDNIFLYCLDSMSEIRFLSAFTNTGGWKSPNLNYYDYGHNTSSLPEGLESSQIALPNLLNYHYAGPRDARINLLRRSIWNVSEWSGSSEVRFRMGMVEQLGASSSAKLPWALALTSTLFSSLVAAFA